MQDCSGVVSLSNSSPHDVSRLMIIRGPVSGGGGVAAGGVGVAVGIAVGAGVAVGVYVGVATGVGVGNGTGVSVGGGASVGVDGVDEGVEPPVQAARSNRNTRRCLIGFSVCSYGSIPSFCKEKGEPALAHVSLPSLSLADSPLSRLR